ncbi:NlpC/P60 family protein [Actinomadura flavalba]|uniref:NlpC/P60 family protein n=1 Tax=Actinomadura flavalba TaxID=1120938 RepID=UPI0003A0D765|nr:NlpC/P60 family protein [Actinomadura flavalba]
MASTPTVTAAVPRRARSSGAARRIVVWTSAAAVGASLFVPPVPVRADPAPSARDVERGREQVRDRAAEVGRIAARLAQADGELEALSARAAAAVERYNGEQVKLGKAREAHAEAQRRVADAATALDRARAETGAFASDAYRHVTGATPWSAVVSGQGGPQGFLDRATMIELIARRRADHTGRVEAARTVADVMRRQAVKAVDAQNAATERAEDAKREAESLVAEQREAVGRIEARKAELERLLGAERAKARALERRRKAALEAAEARRARSAFGGNATVTGSSRGATVVRYALRWLGTPYSWGGGTPAGPSYGIAHGSGIHGFDCSGIALYAWSKVGVRLDHWTGTQWTSGPHIPIGRLRPGDLVFFANNTSDPDTIHHVGIFIGNGKMVEAPYTGARVRIASIYRSGLIGATRPAG